MSTDTTEPQANGHVRPMLAVEAPTEVQLSEAAAPAYFDTTGDGTIKRLPIIPIPLRRVNLPGTVTQAAGLGWHRTRYHGLRFPLYLIAYLWHAVRGAGVLTGQLVMWWHAPHLHILLSQAVAAGRPGHQHAMAAHTEGRKVRKARGQIIAACAVVALIAGLVMARFSPWYGWALLGLVLVAVLERHGRKPGRSLIQPAVVAPKYEPPTPAVITRALASLQISGINEVIRDGKGITFVTDVHRDGEGWSADLDLPHGVTSKMILAKREQLASGLRRPLSATWPEPVPHEHEGRLRLWVGFRDISKVKPAPWPLLRSGQTDLFDPFPFGTDPRGRQVGISLFENNVLVGAAPGQGKTSAVRVMAAAAALDPLTEVWIHELAGKGDLEPFACISHRYCSGLDDEAIGYAAGSLRQLRGELERRSQSMKRLPKEARPDGKITRVMASRRSMRLFPLVAIFDEVQNLFTHDKYGDQAKDDAGYVIRLGRAYGIILILATQRPDAQMLPTAISGNVTLRFCLKVPGQPENDLILGTSSYRNGFNATVFRPKVDAGLGWLKAEGDPQVVRTYYLDLPAAERIAERARVMRGQAGTLTGYSLGEDDTGPARSFAADVLAVFGADEKLWSHTIAARLAEQLPAVYADITPPAVTSQLRALGVTVKNVREPGCNPAPGCERTAVEAVQP